MRRLALVAACCLVAVAATSAMAADLPRPARHGGPVVFVAPPVVIPVPVPVVVVPARGVCAPGYAPASDVGPCLRHGELAVACSPDGTCRPLPPDPLPYGLGPFSRLNY